MITQQTFALALQHHQAGRLAEAEALYRQILTAQPNHAGARHYLGVLAHHVGRHDFAVEWIRQAIVLDPGNPAAHSNLGQACRALGRLDEAVAAYRRALALQPDFPEAHCNLGVALAGQGQHDQAIAAYHRALALKPDFAEAENNLGNVLRDRGNLDEAMAAYRRALALKPDYPEAHSNLGAALTRLGQFDEAVAAYRRALALHPDHPEVHYNLGHALCELGQLDDAIAAYRRALQLKPDFASAHGNLAKMLAAQGQLDEAMAAFRQALDLQPANAALLSDLILVMNLHPGCDARSLREEQARWNHLHVDPLRPAWRPHGNDPDPSRPLRIGYVSPDFRDHVVGRNVLPLLEQHDRERFQVLCYSAGGQTDAITGRFRALTATWRDAEGMSDEQLAQLVRDDGVDILVDLALHTTGNRLPVFARRPAPVQVSFAGYPASTGVEAIGHRISDHYLEGGAKGISDFGFRISDVVPSRSLQSNIKHQTSNMPPEQVCLIDSFWCYDPCGVEVAVNALPAQENGRITFGTLSYFCKINEPVLKLWARVLGKVKDSRLVLLGSAGSHRQQAMDILRREGVEAHRVEFVEPRPRRTYLELYHRLDIVLDPFPYNGHTTSLDALWMGVPVITLAGRQSVSRAGYSQLSNLGLHELVAFSEDAYVEIAAQLAHDLPRLTALRATLRPRLQASPLMDAPRFARNIEAAYRTMWQQWCAENP